MEILQSKEVGMPWLGVAIVNLEGERDSSLHEPIGVEVVSSKLQERIPGLKPWLYDTQPELATTGIVNTDKLATSIREQASDPTRPFLLGLGVPIYSYEYMRSLLLKLEIDPPKSPMQVVLGNAIPTYTDARLIRRDFPDVILVKGEGEEVFAQIAQDMIDGKVPAQDHEHAFPNLRNYSIADRSLTRGIQELGGSIKVEASRGCDFGKCTFCSRCDRTGADYRTVPVDKVVAQMHELLSEFDISRFELTDEEAFGDVEATSRLVSAAKSADLPRVPFTASLRVEVFNRLHENGLLTQLQEIGLDKVFLGAEGGSDRYLRSIGKGQSVAEIRQALDLARKAQMNLELGFITFSWKMDFDMLVENVEFLSEEHDGIRNADYVSALFNQLSVRAGTQDEQNLKRYVVDGDIEGYDPDEEFSINLSMYQNVPFMDERVAAAYEEVSEFARRDADVYYATKSAVRAGSLPESDQQKLKDYFISMKEIHLDKLRQAVGLNETVDLAKSRHELIKELDRFAASVDHADILTTLRREIDLFLRQEHERSKASGDQIGSMAVCRDEQGRILLVRPRGDEEWSFPGGNVNAEEAEIEACIREVIEELGVVKIEMFDRLPNIVKKGHFDKTTGARPSLVLHHHLASIDPAEIDIANADYEIADTIWLPPEMIAPLTGESRLKTKPNVRTIARYLQNGVVEVEPETVKAEVRVRRRDRGADRARGQQVLFRKSQPL